MPKTVDQIFMEFYIANLLQTLFNIFLSDVQNSTQTLSSRKQSCTDDQPRLWRPKSGIMNLTRHFQIALPLHHLNWIPRARHIHSKKVKSFVMLASHSPSWLYNWGAQSTAWPLVAWCLPCPFVAMAGLLIYGRGVCQQEAPLLPMRYHGNASHL
jgi:hypothetical protein